MTSNTSSKKSSARSEEGAAKKHNRPRENRGHYIDGLHTRDPSEYFYAMAPAYLQTYQNPWNARIIRGSKRAKGVEKSQKKSKLSKVLDRIMAVAITYKLSPYKKDIRRQAKHFESRRNTTWLKQIGSMFIVAAGGVVGTGLRFGDWLRRVAASAKRSVTNIGTHQREHVLAAAIVGVASVASIGLAGAYVSARGSYVPVEPITTQSNSLSTQPFGHADDADQNNGQSGISTSADCSENDNDTIRPEMLNEEQDSSHSTTETNTLTTQESSTQQSDGSEATTSSSTSSTQESSSSTDNTTDNTDSTQDSTEQNTLTCLTEQTQSTLDDPLAAVEPTDEYCLE